MRLRSLQSSKKIKAVKFTSSHPLRPRFPDTPAHAPTQPLQRHPSLQGLRGKSWWANFFDFIALIVVTAFGGNLLRRMVHQLPGLIYLQLAALLILGLHNVGACLNSHLFVCTFTSSNSH